jgi:uncharacterized membrane protein required for colicin V production
MTAIKPKEHKRSFGRLIPPLLIGALGVFGVAALYALNLGFRSIEFVPLLIIVCAAAVGYLRGIVRGILTLVILYISTGVAALFYRALAPYVHAVGEVFSFNINASIEAGASRGSQAFAFVLLAVIFWFLLELIARATLQSPDMPQIGILDKLGGVLVHLAVGVLVAALLFNAAGYGRSRPRHDQAYLRRTFNQVLYLHYMSQSFWFGRNPPSLYTYDLNAR